MESKLGLREYNLSKGKLEKIAFILFFARKKQKNYFPRVRFRAPPPLLSLPGGSSEGDAGCFFLAAAVAALEGTGAAAAAAAAVVEAVAAAWARVRRRRGAAVTAADAGAPSHSSPSSSPSPAPAAARPPTSPSAPVVPPTTRLEETPSAPLVLSFVLFALPLLLLKLALPASLPVARKSCCLCLWCCLCC